MFVRSRIPQTRTRESARESPSESKCQIWSTSIRSLRRATSGCKEQAMAQTYAIRGGQSGRERLRVLSHVQQAGTFDFLDKLGVRPGNACLDVGCGGGDVARELARRVGTMGRVVGLDRDAAQLQIVRDETAAQNIHNIDYRVADVAKPPSDLGSFDLVYTRFLLCHLNNPGEALSWM